MSDKLRAFGSAGPQPVWYHGPTNRTDAESKLRGTPDGTYLVRDSSSSQGDFVLSASETGRVSHYIIQRQMSGEYSIGDKLFPDIVHVLEFYNTHLLDTTTLLAPLPLESAAQNGVLSPNFIMEVEGLFNFYAKDPEDLSFKKGDHLNVLEKHEEQWWRAQSKRTLQIGCIPANYVREIPRARPVAAVQERPNDLQRSRSVLEPRLEKRAPKPLPPEPAAVTPAPVLAPRAPPVAPAAAAAAPPAGPVQPQRPKFIVARATMDRVANAYDPTALSFSAGDVIQVSVQNENGLWEGSVMGKEEKVGHFPFTLVELMDSAEYDEEIHQLEIKFEYEMDQIYGSM